MQTPSGGTADSLLPRPRLITVDGPVVRLAEQPLSVERSGRSGHTDLPPEGYALVVSPDGVRIVAADEAGERHARVTLAELGESVEALTIIDWPTLPRRGVIEGFYGDPWTHEQRIDLMAFSERMKLNSYVYAPKDDPFHRLRWREPYPPDELNRLAELVRAAARHGVDFVYALHPAVTMRFSDPADHAALLAKAEQLWSIGIRSIALLFDDVEPELSHPPDLAHFGDDAGSLGAAHGATCAMFQREFLEPHGVTDPVLMVPMDYAGIDPSLYRDRLRETLPENTLVWWTGHDIVVGEVTRDHIDAAAASYGRPLLLWDNYPVNDFDRTRLFLGPLQGRTTDVVGSALRGISVNPMVEYEPSKFAIASAAEWAWNPESFDEASSAERALHAVAGADAEALRPLVAALSAWPPSAPQAPRLTEQLHAELEDTPAIGLVDTLDALAAAPRRVDATTPLARALDPWLRSGASIAEAARAAVRLLRGSGDAERVAALLRDAEEHYAGVLRPVLPPFIRETLRRAGALPEAEGDGPLVHVLYRPQPRPGELALLDALRARGLRVGAAAAGETPDLVVVMRDSDRDQVLAAATPGVPVLAWAHLRELGMATGDAELVTQETVEVVAADDPLAAGSTGRVRVYRGPGFMTSSVPLPGGVVVARTVAEQRPVIVRYPAADGRAERVAFFLAGDALSPWLVTPEGARLLDAALDHLLAPALARTTA
ncbi:beta-N-acetylglucosaminidase [Diaminobutyricimonas aerilata]|uniref:Beta-N-acetylglucosaminidase n=1 Tax=Diaminobutyricimonas aerilata TaxID=1162967 RepID=A0A2M9CH88_9MICO|nr:beta-N-acetylglucosaminidase domain-containing protein [Diaminobutyricimonas aerilata]PJJ71286.1 beta-N-acetylglucosaminidase [Diaminobutyricimonas aerilata]